LAAVAGSHSTAQTASKVLYAAYRVEMLSAGISTLIDAALLSYFKVIESIAEALGKSVQPSDSEYGALVESLRVRLNQSGPAPNQAAQITNAANAVHRLEGKYLNQKIAAAGRVLKLDAVDLATVEKLRKLRNTRLGHAGGTGAENLSEFLPEARRAARRFLAAYLRLVVDQTNSAGAR
jgi:hypothetical protein